MALPLPNLDDKQFDALIDEAIKLIPRQAEAWTDHNRHDPGITFIELFGWLTEMQQFYLNRIRDENVLKFLKLLGTRPRTTTSATTDVTFRFIQPTGDAALVPAGTPLRAHDLVFETDASLLVVPSVLTKVLSASPAGLQDHTDANGLEGLSFPVFGTTAEAQSRLYLGVDQAFPVGQRISLTFHLFDEYPQPRGQHGDEPSEIVPSAVIEWEYYQSSGSWMPVTILHDETLMLAQSGRLFFTIADAMQQRTIPPMQDNLFWLRATVREAGYELPPRADTIVFNTVPALERETLSIVLSYSSTGLPNQTVDAGHYLAIHGDRLVQVDEGGGAWKDWQQQDDLTGSGPDDRHYLIEDENNGPITIRFGDGEHGRVPPQGEQNIRLIASQSAFTPQQLIGRSNGLPGQLVSLDRYPVIAAHFLLQVEELDPQAPPDSPEHCWRDWQRVDDFDASRPEDRHYVLHPETAELRFGDGIHGAIPSVPEDNTRRSIRVVQYQVGGGASGNVSAGALTMIAASGLPNLQATNRRAATGGSAPETLEEAQTRVRRELKTPFRAVTTEDFEQLARATPGLRVARAQAIPLYSPRAPQEQTPAAVTVVVVPFSEADRPIPSPAFLLTVCRHLDKHRLITTQLHVIRPDYVEVDVRASVTLRPGFESATTLQRIEEALRTFLHPLHGGPAGEGWPFGRTVYKSEIYQQIENVDGVDCAENVVLTATGRGITRSAEGHIVIPPHSLVYAGEHDIEVISPGLVCRVKGASR